MIFSIRSQGQQVAIEFQVFRQECAWWLCWCRRSKRKVSDTGTIIRSIQFDNSFFCCIWPGKQLMHEYQAFRGRLPFPFGIPARDEEGDRFGYSTELPLEAQTPGFQLVWRRLDVKACQVPDRFEVVSRKHRIAG